MQGRPRSPSERMWGRAEAPAVCVAGRHSEHEPSPVLAGSWAVGRGIVRARGLNPGGQTGGQLPRDDVTSVTAVTLKISVAAEGLLPFSAQILLFPLTWSWAAW